MRFFRSPSPLSGVLAKFSGSLCHVLRKKSLCPTVRRLKLTSFRITPLSCLGTSFFILVQNCPATVKSVLPIIRFSRNLPSCTLANSSNRVLPQSCFNSSSSCPLFLLQYHGPPTVSFYPFSYSPCLQIEVWFCPLPVFPTTPPGPFPKSSRMFPRSFTTGSSFEPYALKLFSPPFIPWPSLLSSP